MARAALVLPVRAWTAMFGAISGAITRWRKPVVRKRLIHRLDELDRTTAFDRVATRHCQARVSRRVLALAVIALLAVLAARAVAAPAGVAQAPVVVLPSDCDPESGCEDGGNEDGGGGNDGTASLYEGDSDGIDADTDGVIPRVVKHPRVAQLDATPCDCPRRLPFTIDEVTAAAVRAAGLDQDPTPGWNKRARLAGLVPMFSARVGRNLTWKEVDDPTLGYTNMYDVRGTWHLERLLFDPNEIRIAAIDVSRRREKRRVEMLAAHTYLAWAKVPRASERAELLAADLDALTEGWFSRALAKPGKP